MSDFAISTPLWRLLSSNHASEIEIAEIAEDPALREECGAVATKLAIRAAGAGEASVRHALQPLVLVYGVAEAARSPAFWQPYKVLATLPVEALRLGIQDYTSAADSEFFPKPGPLKALCEAHAAPIRKAAFRASRAIAMPPPKRLQPTDEERAAVHRMAAGLADSLKMAAKSAWPKPKGGEFGSIAGKTDERGVTPEMRKLMARRAEEA